MHLGRDITEREGKILGLVIRSFIDTAGPVGSKFLAENYGIGLSAASIRITMNALEELGYLGHPHTSAGRIPTDLGYRKFVDQLMKPFYLPGQDQKLIEAHIEQMIQDPDFLLKECSRLLGQLSNLLGVVLSPRLSTGVLERLEIVPLSSSRVMFVLSLRGRFIKTLILEVHSDLSRDELEEVMQLLNERLAGLTLEEIRKSYGQRLKDVSDEPTGIVKLVLSSSRSFFGEDVEGRVQVAGTQNIVTQPEFLNEPEELTNLIEMLENANFVVQLLEEENDIPGRASVLIGSENVEGKIEKYSVVKAQYQFGEVLGTVGVIGPKRMNYPRIFAIVEGMATLLSRTEDIKH